MSKTFGTEYGAVVEKVFCSRCGAPAVVRARIKEGARSYENNLTCNKCHLIEFIRMTTHEQMLDQKMYVRLTNLRDKAKSKREYERIDSKIRSLEERMVIHELSKFPDRSSLRSVSGKEEDTGIGEI